MARKMIMTIVCVMFVFLNSFVFADTNVQNANNAQNVQDEKSSQEVYATKNGKKYHKVECPFIQGKKAGKISKQDALAKKLTPCPKCFKEDLPPQAKKN